MQHTIEDTLLSPSERQTLAKLLASYYAALADQTEKEVQAELRALADTRPEPDECILAAAESDRTTTYVPGVRGIRRVVSVAQQKPVAIDAGTFGPATMTHMAEAQQQVTNGVATPIKPDFLTRVRDWVRKYFV